MDPERWIRLKHEFDQLAALEPADRAHRLEILTRADPVLSTELRVLLDGDAHADDRLRHLDLITNPAGTQSRTSDPAHAVGPDGTPGHPGTVPAPANPDMFGLAGRTISHFLVRDVLGAGGMGVVYRAEDTQLRRTVALKFLLPQYSVDPTARDRFLHEARAASALDHPNVCTIHEVGTSDRGHLFLAMPVYAGVTLKDRLARDGALTTDAAVDIARQTLLGLAAAHDAGITHRDLKPANLMITPDGTVKILDFGLAKMKDLQLTHPGLRAGTVAYMSPEQLADAPLDQRTDLWSLGVVLYEMLTGTRPFGGGHDLSTLYSILHEEPVPPSALAPAVPQWLDALVASLMRSIPDERCATAADALAVIDEGTRPPHPHTIPHVPHARAPQLPSPSHGRDRVVSRPGVRSALVTMLVAAVVLAGVVAFPALRSFGRAAAPVPVSPAPATGSLAVLPFVNYTTPGTDEQYFADGVTEEILNALAQLPELRVIARTSSFAFKDTNLRARDIAQQLGVAAVLEGSVSRAGNRLRINTRLIDARTESRIWSATLDRDIDDIFAVYTEIARSVAAALEVRLAPGSEPAAPPTRSVPALERYYRGLSHWNRRTTQDLHQAIRFFEEATLIDSTYAQPYAGLALAHTVMLLQDRSVSAADVLRAVETAAARALALNPYLAEAHAARGYLYHWLWRWDDAERELNQAIALNPAYATAHQWYGEHLTKMGREREGDAEMRTAMALDPSSLVIQNDYGILLMLNRRFDQAIAHLERVHRMDPGFSIPLQIMHRVHLLNGNAAAAADAGRRWAELSGVADPAEIALLALATRDTMLRPRALTVLERWSSEPTPRWPDIAMYYALLDQQELSIRALQHGIRSREPLFANLKVVSWLDPMRDDPRVIAIMRQMAFP